ncbi:hypothetical protein [Streptomyces sp. NPDC093591]|uniref:hypothetical protein n=1 Tax=Streptomyces sp. NPDC093591 TaxID=3366044 RepID=UPI003819D555
MSLPGSAGFSHGRRKSAAASRRRRIWVCAGQTQSQRLRTEAEASRHAAGCPYEQPNLVRTVRMQVFVEEGVDVSDAQRRLCSDVAMEPIWTSVVAVVGTLLGAVATYPFQRLAAKQQTLRDERIAAYTAFAAAVEDFRYGQAERFFHKERDPDGEEYKRAYHEGHRLRMTARQAFYRVKLVTDDDSLVTLARAALDRTRDTHNAQNAEARDELNGKAKEAIEAFVDYASKSVQ